MLANTASRPAPPLIRLSWSQFVVTIALAAALAAGIGILFAPDLQDRYARRALQDFEREFGFETGTIVMPASAGAYPAWGITRVTPQGRFERLGFRAGDVPFAHHRHGASALYYVVRAASQGRSADIDVYNASDVGNGRSGLRRVVVAPSR